MMREGGQHSICRLRLMVAAALLLIMCLELQTMLPTSLDEAVSRKERTDQKALFLQDENVNSEIETQLEEKETQDEETEKETAAESSTSTRTVEKEISAPSDKPSSVIDPEKDRRIVYLHLGKTGGTSLDTRFRSNCQWYNNRGIQTKCFENLQEDTKLSKLVVNTFHMSMRAFNRKYLEPQSSDISFLISIRNPIARIVSSFNYEHPKNRGWGPPVQRRFYNDCYDTFPKLMDGISSDNTTECSETAIHVLRGEGPHQISGHMYWNLHHHASYIPEASEVFVVRTENLWDDFNDLDRQLGGDAAVENLKADYGSSQFVVKSGVSFPNGSPEMIQLCCILQVETATYQSVLLKALNLNERQKRETLEIVYQQCGAEAEQDGNPVNWTRWAQRNGCNDEYATVKQIDK